MVMLHQPGDKMFIDFAGDKLHYMDRETGKSVPVEVLLITEEWQIDQYPVEERRFIEKLQGILAGDN